jgi:hypothetical protein
MKTKLLHAGLLLWLLVAAACKHTSETPPSVLRQSFASDNIAFADTPSQQLDESSGDTKVFVCKSSGAKKYHFNENCHGLKRCKHEIIESTQKSAAAKGLGLCGYED